MALPAHKKEKEKKRPLTVTSLEYRAVFSLRDNTHTTYLLSNVTSTITSGPETLDFFNRDDYAQRAGVYLNMKMTNNTKISRTLEVVN